MRTLVRNRHLFKIVCPINVGAFERLLEDHPNPLFVQSVVRGLREGFWPWADTRPGDYPSSVDASYGVAASGRELEFLRSQRDEEVRLGRFSPSFGPALLPGMYSSPTHAVPKPRSNKFRMIVNQSFGVHSPNSMISHEDVAGARLDSLKQLGQHLIELRREHGPAVQLVVWKSDVSQAYRRLPVHPLWQLKQVVTVDGLRHVDRCNEFGNRGAARIWIAFMGLVVWVANVVRLTKSFLYMDDNFGAVLADQIEYYPRYESHYPADQVATLRLWDELGIPHEPSKQVYGEQLLVVGFVVDTAALTFRMDEDRRVELIAGISDFIQTASGNARRHTLREFQRIAGWVNWSLNVYPLLRPALSHLYDKIAGKSNPEGQVFVSKGIIQDLDWFLRHVRVAEGLLLLEQLDWGVDEADLTVFCDASLSGLGFFLDGMDYAFQAHVPDTAPRGLILVFEALCICWALHKVEHIRHEWDLPEITRVVVWTDSQNTVDMFSSLSAKPLYNGILQSAVDVLVRTGLKLRVLHISGERNIVADALSCFKADVVRHEQPSMFVDDTRIPPAVSWPARSYWPPTPKKSKATRVVEDHIIAHGEL